ncbi:MAG: hypothetical protein Q9190_006910, partial [Brigantiaea leucoxantha]
MTRGDEGSSAASPLSPPKVETGASKNLQNTSKADQSPLAKSLTRRTTISSSPQQHQRFKSITTTSHAPTASLQPSQSTDRPTSSPSSLQTSAATGPSHGSYFSSQPAASGVELRSPPSRRAPASRSSHGIATTGGPPPALITQRSYHGEQGRSPSHTNQSHPPPVILQRSQVVRSNSLNRIEKTETRRESKGAESKTRAHASSAVARAMTATASPSVSRVETEEDDTIRTLNGISRNKPIVVDNYIEDVANGQEQENSHSSHEDLFLNLARADSEIKGNAELSSGNDRRRVSAPGNLDMRSYMTSQTTPSGSRYLPKPRPSSSGRPASSGRTSREQPDILLSRWAHGRYDESPILTKHISPRDRTYAASAHPLDQRKRYLHSELSSRASFTPRIRNSSTRETSPEQPGSYNQKEPTADSSSGLPSRGYKPSNRSYLSNGNSGSSPFPNHSAVVDRDNVRQPFRIDGTESTISTTAPSTVWDELDDLKSRIRKLELTGGRLPSSSDAAISGAVGERPPTATTTMTTASISPKHGQAKKESLGDPVIQEKSTLHPLLHSALANTRTMIDPKLYKVLDATASDALALAAMTSTSGHQSSIQGPAADQANFITVERQLQRKADSMCRSLTELCIALSEDKSNSNSNSHSRAPSRDTEIPGHTGGSNQGFPRSLRAASQEPERSSSRIMNRLEARRASLLAANRSRESSQEPTAPLTETPPSSTANQTSRTPSALYRRRTTNPTRPDDRPVSRATTDIASYRPSPQTTPVLLEHGSKHQLPTKTINRFQHTTPPIHSNLPVRRNYLDSPSNNSPSTP